MGFVTRSARVEPELCEDTGNTADQAAGDPTDPGEIARDETNRRFPGGQTIGGVNLPSPAPRALRPYGESGARPYDDDAWDALDDIKQDTMPRVNPFLSDELIDSIKQAYVAGLGGDTVARFRRHSGESLDGQLANRARPGDCSVDEFATCNLGYQTRGGVGSYPGNHQYDASTDNTTGGSLFPSAAPAPVQSLSQAVVNALAKRRLEESKVTNAEKMEARIRGRVHYSGGSTGGFDPPFPKSPVKSKDETAETETTSVAARRESDDSDSDSDNDGAEPDPTSPGTKKSASNSPRGGTPRGTRRKKTISSLYDQHLGRRSKAGRYFRKSRVRRVCVRFAKQAKKLVSKIVTSEDFELLVILMIFANCVSLALYRPAQGEDSPHNETLSTLELSLNVFFTLELLLRTIHVGSLRRYLRDPWNKFDFSLVFCGYAGIVAETLFLSNDESSSGGTTGSETNIINAVRALRALRPLRTITRFESLRSVVVCFVEAVPLLVSVCGLVCFFAFVFAVAGQMLFSESHHQRCQSVVTGLPEFVNGDEFGCAIYGRAGIGTYGRVCGVGGMIDADADASSDQGDTDTSASNNSNQVAPASESANKFACAVVESGRGHSVAGFDNIALGMLTVFQCTTLAGWAQVMYRTMDSGAELAIPYFVCLVFFGSYFVVNLFLAVLKSKFGRARAVFFNTKLGEGGGGGSAGGTGTGKQSTDSATGGTVTSPVVNAQQDGTAADTQQHVTGTVSIPKSADDAKHELDDGDDLDCESERKDEARLKKTNTLATVVYKLNRRVSRWVHQRKLESDKREHALALTLEKELEDGEDDGDDQVGKENSSGKLRAFLGKSGALRRKQLWSEFRESCRELAEHPRFNQTFLVLICLNTLTMSIEHHGMSPTLQWGLVIANTVFTFFFTVEVLVKILGLGAWHFFSENAFNRFDFLLVALALVELFTLVIYDAYDPRPSSEYGDGASEPFFYSSYSSYSNSSSASTSDYDAYAESSDDASFVNSPQSEVLAVLSYLKALRTFRVFKMFQYLSSLRVIGEVLVSSLSSFVSIAALLFLFMIVFAIVGLHVFGGANQSAPFVYGVDDPQLGGRASFDTFYLSIITVFQVLTLEDWEFIMFRTVNYAGWSSSLFFVVWVIVGKYTFLTLFLAVTMEAFESKYDAQASGELKLVAAAVAKKRLRRKKRFADIRRRRKEKEDKKKWALSGGGSSVDLVADLEVGAAVDGDGDQHDLSVVTVVADSANDVGAKHAPVSATGADLNNAGTAIETKASLSRSVSKRSDDSVVNDGSEYSPFSDVGSDIGGYGSQNGSGSESGYNSGAMSPNYGGYDQDGYASGAVTPGGYDREHGGLDSVVGSRSQSFVGSGGGGGGRQSGMGGGAGVSSRKDTARDKATALSEWSLCVPPHHRFRESAYDVVKHPVFEKSMFFLIFVSCVTMALEKPGMDKNLATRIKTADAVLAGFFTAEVLLKSFALGPKKFLREKVNKLDLFIVCFTIFEIALTNLDTGLGFVKSLRVLRAVRPLRALTKSPGMRLVLKSVMLSIGAMFNVSAVLLLTFAVFGILGVQIFAGTFFSCTDPNVFGERDCTGSYPDPTRSGVFVDRVWQNSDLNFDSLPNALVSLFVASTLDGYGQLMFDGLDSVGVHRQPKRDANPPAFLFFCAFIVLCAFSLLNLYVGVIFYQFSRIRTLSQTSSYDLTEPQMEWAEMCKCVLRVAPRRKTPIPGNEIRAVAYRIVHHAKFETYVLLVLVCSAITTASKTRDESFAVTVVRNQVEVFFFALFLSEAVLKITALGPKEYKRDKWNRFDFACVFFSFLDVTCEAFLGAALGNSGNSDGYSGNSYGNDGYRYDVTAGEASPLTTEQIVYLTTTRFLGVAKVLTVLRIIKHAHGLRALLETLVASLPAFWNVGALVLLLFFIYAYVGVITFGTTVRAGALNEHANFESFPYAMLTLFRVATNDEWVGVMQASSTNPNTGWASYAYFISFVILVSMVMLNLFTAVIIENFENSQDHDKWRVNPNALRKYVEVFHKYDDGSGTVRGVDLESLLREIPPPLGLGNRNGAKGHKESGATQGGHGHEKQTKDDDADEKPPRNAGMLVVHFITSLNVPLDKNGRVPFKRTAFELVRRVCETDMPPGDMRDGLQRAVRRQFPDLWDPIPPEMSWQALMCVVRVQRHWRARVAKRKRIKRIEETLKAEVLAESIAKQLARESHGVVSHTNTRLSRGGYEKFRGARSSFFGGGGVKVFPRA